MKQLNRLVKLRKREEIPVPCGGQTHTIIIDGSGRIGLPDHPNYRADLAVQAITGKPSNYLCIKFLTAVKKGISSKSGIEFLSFPTRLLNILDEFNRKRSGRMTYSFDVITLKDVKNEVTKDEYREKVLTLYIENWAKKFLTKDCSAQMVPFSGPYMKVQGKALRYNNSKLHIIHFSLRKDWALTVAAEKIPIVDKYLVMRLTSDPIRLPIGTKYFVQVAEPIPDPLEENPSVRLRYATIIKSKNGKEIIFPKKKVEIGPIGEQA